MSDSTRRKKHERNQNLEELLQELNAYLSLAEREATCSYGEPDLPTIFVVGPPRSFTTLTMQWLSQLGHFAYPTNLLSRFYKAPYLGALIQKLLTDSRYQFRDELFDLEENNAAYESHLGKTSGALQPNWFGYFWRRFIPNNDIRPLNEFEVNKVDQEGLRNGIASIEAAIAKPVAMKGMILQYNLSLLYNSFEKIIFIHTERSPVYNAQSLIEARQDYYGDIQKWYSAKPPGYKKLLNSSPYAQAAGQVILTNKAINSQLANLPSHCRLNLRYEDFCSSPLQAYRKLCALLQDHDFDIPEDYAGPSEFTSTNQRRLPTEEFRKLEMAVQSFNSS